MAQNEEHWARSLEYEGQDVEFDEATIDPVLLGGDTWPDYEDWIIGGLNESLEEVIRTTTPTPQDDQIYPQTQSYALNQPWPYSPLYPNSEHPVGFPEFGGYELQGNHDSMEISESANDAGVKPAPKDNLLQNPAVQDYIRSERGAPQPSFSFSLAPVMKPTNLETLLEESQIVVEQVGGWYDEMETTTEATNEISLSTPGCSYSVQLVALNFHQAEMSLIISENSTFREVGFRLYSANPSMVPAALEYTCGPFPQWRVPPVDSKVPRGLQKIYVADINEPFTLALVRGVKGDSPLLLPLSEFNRATVGELVGARLGVKPNGWASIRLLSGSRDVQQLPWEMVQNEIEGVYSTSLFVLLTDDPFAYRFRNTFDGRVPPPLQVVFPQCRNLVESAPRLKAFTFQAIDLSRALLHLAICLAEAILETGIEGPIQAYLISRLKGLKEIFTDIADSTDEFAPSIARSLHHFFHEICEEQPGVVSVRYSFESFKELTPLDDEDVYAAHDGPDEVSRVHRGRLLGVHHLDTKAIGLASYVAEKDSAGSSDSLTVSDGESVDSSHQPSQGPQKVGPRTN